MEAEAARAWSRAFFVHLRSGESESAHRVIPQESDLAGADALLGTRRMADRANQRGARSAAQVCAGCVAGAQLADVYARHFAKLVHRSGRGARSLRAGRIQDGG